MVELDEQLAMPKKKQSDDKRKLWEGGFELGLDGAEGNSETFNLRLGFDVKRESDWDRLTLDLDYRKNTTDSDETANRSFFDWRYEYFFPESRWTTFWHGTLEYDEFKVFNLRVTSDLGFGYHLIRNDQTTLSARAGSGFSREIGGPDNRYVPEAVLGLDLEHQFSKRQKVSFSTEYTPDWTGWHDFRLKSRASWESLIDQEMNLSLKLSVLNRYDSTPNGDKANDLDYSIVLLWKF